jgi:thiamine-phosphate pyrophosphorylase
LAGELRGITSEFKARLFVNDRVDVAVAVDADGVHLGHQSMPVNAVRKIVGSRMLIAVSTHTVQEAQAAEQGGADFITFGPVFMTPSKALYGAPVGPHALKEVKNRIRIPVFGLGGITRSNMHEVMQAGSDGIAMISAIIAAGNVQKASEDIVNSLKVRGNP